MVGAGQPSPVALRAPPSPASGTRGFEFAIRHHPSPACGRGRDPLRQLWAGGEGTIAPISPAANGRTARAVLQQRCPPPPARRGCGRRRRSAAPCGRVRSGPICSSIRWASGVWRDRVPQSSNSSLYPRLRVRRLLRGVTIRIFPAGGAVRWAHSAEVCSSNPSRLPPNLSAPCRSHCFSASPS